MREIKLPDYFKFKIGQRLWTPFRKYRLREIKILNTSYDINVFVYRVQYLDNYDEDCFDADFIEEHYRLKVFYDQLWESLNV